MIYEIKKDRIWAKPPKCIFCGKFVYLGDYLYLCKEQGEKYYKIPKILRILLPKAIIRRFL